MAVAPEAWAGFDEGTLLKLRLAGLPVTDEMLDLVEPKAPHLVTRLLNLATVVAHHKQISHIMESAKGLDFIFESSDQAPS